MAACLSAAPRIALTRTAGKRVVVCGLPSSARDPIGPARKAWARDFASYGLIDGQNLEISIVRAKTADFVANAEEWRALAREVVQGRPDAILVHSVWLQFIMPLTRDIPIVFVGMMDAEYFGIVATLGRPGGNVTGALFPFFELQAKRFEMLKELRPEARRIGVVFLPGPYDHRFIERLEATASRLAMDSTPAPIADPKIPGAVANALRDARIDLVDFLWAERDMHPAVIGELIKLGIGSSFMGSDAVRAGALLSYEPTGLVEIAVGLAARILRGEAVATIPAEQARQFRLAINLQTARALRITVPPSFLVRADEVVS